MRKVPEARHVIDNAALVFGVGIADGEVEQEPVQLRFGQWIGRFVFEGILRRQNEEGAGERKTLFADRDLVLLHRLQQRALCLAGRAIDFVRQNDVGEHWAPARDEPAGARLVNQCAGDVGG